MHVEPARVVQMVGCLGRDRTDDPRLVEPVLFLLSYEAIDQAGLEPTTFRL